MGGISQERQIMLGKTGSSDSDPVAPMPDMTTSSTTTVSMSVLTTASIRNINRDEADMSEFFHEIFDSQPTSWEFGHCGTETGLGNVDSLNKGYPPCSQHCGVLQGGGGW